MSEFHEEVKAERRKYDFTKDFIGNMDETPLYFDMVPRYTIEKKGAKEVRVKTTGAGKRRVTIVLACLASGKTLPPMIIFKGKSIILYNNSYNINTSHWSLISQEKHHESSRDLRLPLALS